MDDTIAAVASPLGGAARGIVRLSGPDVLACLRPFFRAQESWERGRRGRTKPVRCPRCQHDSGKMPVLPAALSAPLVLAGSLKLPRMVSPLPCELYLWPHGRSYTGQAVAEIHTLGSPPLLQAALAALCEAGARPAAAGEFTLRAFLAGRLDLTQAEAVLGVIDAVDGGELQVALAQLAGGLSHPLAALRERLVDLLAHLEAGLDFVDEDLPFITPQELRQRLRDAVAAVARLRRQMASRGQPSAAARVVLIGRPNTGKSSLFNALSGDALAIVSQQPGTTRDYLTVQLDLDGVPCQLIDTAGLSDCGDRSSSFVQPEQAAQSVSRQQQRRAHVRILCLDATRSLDPWEQSQLVQAGAAAQIAVLTKVDLGRWVAFPTEGIPTSSLSGEGIGELRAAIRRAVLCEATAGREVVAATALRCRQWLRIAAASLQRARRLVMTGRGEELVAAEIRVALDELGKVVGTVYTDDVLDRVFSRFCIGK